MRGVVLALCLLAPAAAAAGTRYLVVGGGPNIDDSQVSIELNTLWLLDWLERTRPGTPVEVLYGDGRGGGHDVYGQHAKGAGSRPGPLARLFGSQVADTRFWHPHRVPATGPATAAEVEAVLAREVRNLGPGDELVFIYQGHGGYDETDPAGNTLRLWQDTRLSVRDLARILDGAHGKSRVRFFFPQCFSGGFARLIFRGADPRQGLAPQDRCGFLAQAPDRESEGCTPSVDTGDYRDYTTYFFSALAGRTRTGAPLAGEPDADGDGRVSPREAHLYSLAVAESTDLSRSTSEVFLEHWEPWYLRHLPLAGLPANEYGELAARVARRLGLDPDAPGLAAQVRRRLLDQRSRLAVMRRERDALGERVDAAQATLQARLEARWPQVFWPYTRAFRRLLAGGLGEVEGWIRAQPEYPELVQAQDALVALEDRILALERQGAQLEKVLRLRRLARLRGLLERFGGTSARAAYARLLACESAPL